MKIAVIGAGINGMCTAYELAVDGHEVSVFERNAAVAEEASFACGGHVSGSLSHPFAFPSWPANAPLRKLLTPSGISLGCHTKLRDLRWLLAWKMAPKNYPEQFSSAQHLVSYSLKRLHAIASQASLSLERSQGQLLLFKTESELVAYHARLKVLNEMGLGAKILTPELARQLEPALSADLPLHSALHFPNDEVWNCRQFAHVLKERLLALGTKLHFDTQVTAIANSPGIQVHSAKANLGTFDRLVVCTGVGFASLLTPELSRLPLARLCSQSVSAQIREPLNAPRSTVVIHGAQVSISRMGARIRVTGGAMIGPSGGGNNVQVTRRLYHALQNNFPGAADFSRSVQTWQGSSIFSPDGLPLLGPDRRSGVWLNLAHGHNGWSMACGAARVIADQIAGRQTDVDATNLSPERFKS